MSEAQTTFDAPTLERLLAPALRVGMESQAGWTITGFDEQGAAEVAICFERREPPAVARVRVRPRRDDAAAFLRTRAFDVFYSATLGEREDDCIALARVVADELRSQEPDVSFIARPTVERVAREFNMALPAPCGQACSFCSLKTEGLAGDADDELISQMKTRLALAGGRGTRILRINGIEPLNAPYIFELLDHAREHGFDEFHLLSTCRRLSDEEFARRYIEAMPKQYKIFIPIYGSDAARHDGAVGTPGAFDAICAAADNVTRLRRRGGVLSFSTILMRQNADDLDAIRRLVKRWGGKWRVHLPFPSTAGPNKHYERVALSMSQALSAVYPPQGRAITQLELGEVVPCVAMRHQQQTGHRLLTRKQIENRAAASAGTHYQVSSIEHGGNAANTVAYTAPTVRCEHHEGCALAAICSQRVYLGYRDQYGLEELQPVSRQDVLDLRGGRAVLATIEAAAKSGG